MMCRPPIASTLVHSCNRCNWKLPSASSSFNNSASVPACARFSLTPRSSTTQCRNKAKCADESSIAATAARSILARRTSKCLSIAERIFASVHVASTSRGAMSRFFQCSIKAARSILPNLMSVPRPAMFVATMTAASCPALLTMSASRSCCFALRTSCLMPGPLLNMALSFSLLSTLVVPTRTGRPMSCMRAISSMIAFHLSFSPRNTRSWRSVLHAGTLVGILTTSK